MKKNMEEKSNNNKYDNKPYTGGEANDLFRVPDCHANVILKYCDDKTLSNLLTVNKSWNKKINELKLDKRKEYLKYFLWYIYGRGNAERLCKVVDDVVNKLDEDKDKDNKDNIENIMIEEDDDKDQKFDEDKKFLFWHMILLDILNIKMADLKLNFDEEKSKSVEVAINNYLLSDKAVKRRNDFIDTKIKSDHPERLLWEYSRQVFPEFENIQVESGGYWDNINVNVDTAELLGRIFACFLKVSFYQIKRVEAGDTDKNNQEIYKNHKKHIYHFNDYLQKQMFGRLEVCLNDGNLKYKRGKFQITSNIAAYLFETEELEAWFLRYNKDFFSFFCNPNYLLYADDGESTVEFFGFAFYLNKIKSFETRYRESPDGFWQAFYINIVEKKSYRGNQVIADITPFISQTELQNKMRPKIDEFEGYAEFRNYNYDLFNHKKLDTIDVGKKYFSPIIIRFCGQNDLSDKVIQSISKVIKAKDGEDHKDGNKISEKNKVGFQQQPISKVIESKGGTDHEDEANVANNNSMVSRETDLINKNEIGNVNFKLEKKDLANGVIQPVSKIIKSTDVVDHKNEAKIDVENNPVQNNLIASNEINNKINFVNGDKISSANNKLGDKNKVSFWQHFIFVLFFIFACLSLFLCFKISLYFLILFAIFTACDLYLGFKNYCRGCCCTLKIKTPAIDQGENSLVTIHSNEPTQNLIDYEIKI